MAHLHLNELSLISDMWLNKITYLLTYLLNHAEKRKAGTQDLFKAYTLP